MLRRRRLPVDGEDSLVLVQATVSHGIGKDELEQIARNGCLVVLVGEEGEAALDLLEDTAKVDRRTSVMRAVTRPYERERPTFHRHSGRRQRWQAS